MCGISGIVVPPGQVVPRGLLAAMNNTLRRRGPDDEGYYFDDAGGCGIGHRRLSIIDLAGGHQPLASKDGQLQVVVNGELYNFREIRSELIGLGYQFRTNSDSEVVVHGYDAWGESVLERIQGMFAVALWDGRRRRLLLARDRMGKKPMYYAILKDRTFIFGSELKALLQHPELERKISPEALSAYLTYECFPETLSVYRSVQKLLPGHWLSFERESGKLDLQSFWKLRFADTPEVAWVQGKTEAQLASELRHRIREATRARLISDVPLGVFLSGGIDSSTVAAAMADLVPRNEIKTFSITFADRSFDEGPYARKVAAHLGTDHHEEQLSPQAMLDILPEVADFMCEPIGDASVIPTYLLSRFTRKTVTVALGGDGGDELFLGYPTFQADRMARRLDAVLPISYQRWLGRRVLNAAALLPVSRKNFSLDFKIKRFAQGLGYPPDLRHQAWMGSFLPEELAVTLASGLRHPLPNPYSIIEGYRQTSGARNADDLTMYQYLRLYLIADVLVKVDRASMATGLEVRAPLLDTRVVELAAAIPASLKLKGLTTKYLLKQAARGWLPDEIIDRPKKGFGVPIGEWLRGPLKSMAYDLLAPAKLRREGLFDPDVVGRLLDEHQRGKADHRKSLWTLLAFELWLERYGPSQAPAVARPALRAVG